MNVYVMTCDDPKRGSISKVGIARNVAERHSALQRAMGCSVAIVAEFDCGTQARYVERTAHTLLAKQSEALGSEWFTATSDEAIAAVNEAMKPRDVPVLGDDPISRDIQKIEAFLISHGMTESRMGLLACGNPRAVERVRDGSARVETLRALVEFVRRER